MFSKVEGSVAINIAFEVHGVLSESVPKDALTVLHDAKRVIRIKVEERAQTIIAEAAKKGLIAMSAEYDINDSIDYDTVVEILQALVQAGMAKQQMGRTEMEFLKYASAA